MAWFRLGMREPRETNAVTDYFGTEEWPENMMPIVREVFTSKGHCYVNGEWVEFFE